MKIDKTIKLVMEHENDIDGLVREGDNFIEVEIPRFGLGHRMGGMPETPLEHAEEVHRIDLAYAMKYLDEAGYEFKRNDLKFDYTDWTYPHFDEENEEYVIWTYVDGKFNSRPE